jgi:outer membrane protein assembly factor BamD
LRKTNRTIRTITMILIAALLLAGCSSSGNLSSKEMGDIAIDKGDYPKAIEQYQIFLEESLYGDETMAAHFSLAQAYFANQDYPTAAVEFEIFQRDYPRSDSLQAAAFFQVLCAVEQSPRHDRDSEPTEWAIRDLQNFLLDYPGSIYGERATAAIGSLQEKLAEKTLETADLYRGLKKFEAAILYYEKLLGNYPGNEFWERGFLELLKVRLEMGESGEAERMIHILSTEYPNNDLETRAREILAAED